jgi:hypothetical protein
LYVCRTQQLRGAQLRDLVHRKEHEDSKTNPRSAYVEIVYLKKTDADDEGEVLTPLQYRIFYCSREHPAHAYSHIHTYTYTRTPAYSKYARTNTHTHTHTHTHIHPLTHPLTNAKNK